MSGLQRAAMLVLISLLCLACGRLQAKPGVTPSQAGLAYRVIEQAAPLGDHPKDPLYSVITDSAQWDTLAASVPTQALEAGKKAQASALPARQELYLLAFAGVRGTSKYKLSIITIKLEGERCTVVVVETQPAPGEVVEPATTLPYVLAAIPYEALPRGDRLTFVFANPQGTVLSQQEVQIP
jgi:hypothetical protein